MRPTERVTVEEGPMASRVAFGKGIQSLVSDDPVHERAKKKSKLQLLSNLSDWKTRVLRNPGDGFLA